MWCASQPQPGKKVENHCLSKNTIYGEFDVEMQIFPFSPFFCALPSPRYCVQVSVITFPHSSPTRSEHSARLLCSTSFSFSSGLSQVRLASSRFSLRILIMDARVIVNFKIVSSLPPPAFAVLGKMLHRRRLSCYDCWIFNQVSFMSQAWRALFILMAYFGSPFSATLHPADSALKYISVLLSLRICRGLRSKRIKRIEHNLAINIKQTQRKIWQGVTKDVGYLRQILNEVYFLKFKVS
jgi:hypothetical protein